MDFVEEAIKIVQEADARKIVLRIMGAVAFKIHCPNFASLHKALGRELSDLDFMAYHKQVGEVMDFLESLGFTLRWGRLADRKVYQSNNGYSLDVFFDELNMCHKIDFRKRLNIDYPTVSLSELLLEKLQVVRITEKDIKDVIVLLREHDIGDGKELVDGQRLAGLFSRDWGFYYTATTNLKKIRDEFLPVYAVLREEDKQVIRSRINFVLDMVEKEPKNLQWKLRAKIGTSKKWFNEVEEVMR